MRAAAAVVLLALALAAPAAASEAHPTLAEISHEVMCPTCHTLLELSDAPVAQRMRSFIRRRIAAGDTKNGIEAKLVAQFGPGVLAAPPRRGLGLLAWALPLAGVLAGGAALALVGRRRRAAAAEEPWLPDPLLERRLEEELARFDA